MIPVCERHPDRPASASCGLCGMPLCAVCRGTGPEPAACSADHALMLKEWVLLAAAAEWAEVEALHVNLLLAGIDARVYATSDHVAVIEAGGEESRLFVPAAQEAAARRHLENLGLLPITAET